MSLNPGDKINLTIHDIAFGGEGVGRIRVTRDEGQVTREDAPAADSTSPATRHLSPDSLVVFVPFVLVGETVEV